MLAEQRWERPLASFGEGQAPIERPNINDQLGPVIWRVARCQHCRDFSLWVNGQLVHPDESSVEAPNSDLSEPIQRDYREAASILRRSPRGAAALLRLALEKLCGELNAEGDDLNAQISDLVGRGLPAAIQKSLDAVRVTGNEAVHPGLMDIADDEGIAQTLFVLLNIIAQHMVSNPKMIDEAYEKLPERKRQAIERRDTEAGGVD